MEIKDGVVGCGLESTWDVNDVEKVSTNYASRNFVRTKKGRDDPANFWFTLRNSYQPLGGT
jgi:hypothetical protein